MIIKALTISQPYASLIASGEKWVENRRWPTKYRGPLAIHAGKGKQYLNTEELKEYPTGCVIAVVELTACVNLVQAKYQVGISNGGLLLDRDSGTSLTIQDMLSHDHTEGPFCWVLENVQEIEPFPYRGAQGLWDFDLSQIEGQTFNFLHLQTTPKLEDVFFEDR